jgi:hypothetical protein
MTVVLDGVEQHDPVIPLTDDHREHTVEVRIAASRTSPRIDWERPFILMGENAVLAAANAKVVDPCASSSWHESCCSPRIGNAPEGAFV